jgi:superfamily II DNA or RNA helicase
MKFNPLLKKRFNTFEELERLIESLPTTKARGDLFEEFVYAYLKIKANLYQITDIYRSGNIPESIRNKYRIAKKDSGIDGVFILKDGRAAAYQVKFRTARKKPSYEELAKFWTEAEHLDFHYTIANCYSITNLAKKKIKHLQILVDEFENLDNDFFAQLFDITNEKIIKARHLYKPFPFQERMIADVVKGFTKVDRGKLIAACGTGKTLTSLWISEELKSDSILFLAPSLALIKQTLEAWSDQSKYPFSYLCVCSDKSVSSNIEDEGDIALTDFNVPVTTDTAAVVNFLNSKAKGKRIVFSTYQSIPVLVNALTKLPNFTFDLAIFDEAHRTAGAKDSQLFSMALGDEYIKADKRLFATATERLLKPWIKQKAKEEDRVVFSMDDINTYGPVFHRYNFGAAIKEKVISDYKVIVAGIKESELFEWIKENRDLVKIDKGSKEFHTTAYNLFAQLLLAKATKEFPISKIISFHSSVKNATYFTTGYKDILSLDKVLEEINEKIKPDNLYISHINGTMPTGDRKEILDAFKSSGYGIISNARCLTEGIDVPIIDCVYFVDPRNSLIDIVQACGRALRKPATGLKGSAYFIIPILIPDKAKAEDILNQDSFEMVYNVIQSLRDQDNRLSQWIDQLNQNAVKGIKKITDDTDWNPVTLTLPSEVNIKDFEEKLYLKIAEVNANPSSLKFTSPQKFGKNERKTEAKRIFKTLGDYSADSYIANLVEPTLKKFKKEDVRLSGEILKVNHNNISHTERLGLIVKEDKLYSLTPLGKKVFSGSINLKKVFARQMLRKFDVVKASDGHSRLLFPYRACIKILLSVETLNFFEFGFVLFNIYDSTPESIQTAIEGIKFIRSKYPRLDLVSKANHTKILAELNEHFGTNFSVTDIWGKQPTTVRNQFIYFKNHLSLFQDFIKVETSGVSLPSSSVKQAEKSLSMDMNLESERDITKLLLNYLKPFVSVVLFSL